MDGRVAAEGDLSGKRWRGGLWLLTMLLDEFFEKLDANTIIAGKTDYSYDIFR